MAKIKYLYSINQISFTAYDFQTHYTKKLNRLCKQTMLRVLNIKNIEPHIQVAHAMYTTIE